MNKEQFQDKMDPQHRMYFCQMLKVKELPEPLLELYHRVKLMTDHIDGRISPGGLALIVVMAGAAEPVKSVPSVTPLTVARAVEQVGAEADDKKVEEILEPPPEKMPERPVEAPVMAGEQAAEKTEQTTAENEQVGSEVDQQQIDVGQKLPEPEQPATSEKIWAFGMPVKVLTEDELKYGKIVGISTYPEVKGKDTQLTVEFDGGVTVTVDEKDVEAV